MLNATLRIRCISEQALESIVELLRDESNAIFIDTFETNEPLREGRKASVIRNLPPTPSLRTQRR